jgi:hypothetical protein
MKKLFVPGLTLFLIVSLFSGCASMKNDYHYHGSNTYKAELNTVLNATYAAIRKAWLDIDETKKVDKNTYELIIAKKNTAYFKGRSVIENSMRVIVHRIDPNTTEVTIKEPRKPMAVTQSNTTNYQRKIFSDIPLELKKMAKAE